MKYDLIILGSGSASFGAAIKAVDLGAEVAMIEKATIGGTCVNVGCIPSKYLLRVGEINYYRNHSYAGLNVITYLDFPAIINEKREIVEGLRKGKYEDVIQALGITLIKGKAVFVSDEEIGVNESI